MRTRHVLMVSLLAATFHGEAMDVTLKLDDVTVTEAVQQLAKVTGYEMKAQMHGEWAKKRISVNWEGLPFWEAVEQLCDAGDCRCHWWTSSGLRFYGGNPSQCPIYISGPCRFEVTGINRSVSYHQGLDADATFSVSLQAMWEPSWRVTGMASRAQVTVADLDDGTSLVIPDDGERSSHMSRFGRSRRMHHGFSVRLRPPPRLGGLLVSLEGTVTFTRADREEKVVFEDIQNAQNAVADAGGVEVRVDSVETTGGRFKVNATVAWPERKLDHRQHFRSKGAFS
ncbi:hypothetical protein H8D79_00010, partial [PVC group bacterium]|nr:hypothetical protein [PVC group bacterium]